MGAGGDGPSELSQGVRPFMSVALTRGRGVVSSWTLDRCSWWQVAWVGLVFLSPKGGLGRKSIPECQFSLENVAPRAQQRQ